MSAPRYLLFNLYSQGHHAEHIRHLVLHWLERGLPGELHVVVSPRLLAWAPDLPGLAERHAGRGLRLHVEPDAEAVEEPRRFGLLRAAYDHRTLLRRHVLAHRPDHAVLMYYDHAQLALALDLRFGFPVRFSGIYFRPSLHYEALTGARPGPKERLSRLRKKVVLAGALRNPHAGTLFTLDPLAVPAVRRLVPGADVVFLPEPFDRAPSPRPAAETRSRLGIEPGRKMLLLFGALAERKGVYQLLEAVLQLSDDHAARVALVLAGRLMDIDEGRVADLLGRIAERSPAQVVARTERIEDDEVQDLFQAADLALLPYQHHLGSSGILIRAAHEGVPALGPDYGLLGALIRDRRLGRAVDTTRPDALADGIAAFLDAPPADFYDAAELRRFAAENTSEAFASTIFDHLAAPD